MVTRVRERGGEVHFLRRPFTKSAALQGRDRGRAGLKFVSRPKTGTTFARPERTTPLFDGDDGSGWDVVVVRRAGWG